MFYTMDADFEREFMQVVEDIKALRIQGATAIAVEGIRAFSTYAQRVTASSYDEFMNHLLNAKSALFGSRPTEPALRNGLRKIFYELHQSSDDSLDSARELIEKAATEYIELLKETKKLIIKIGSERIPDGTTVMTHCHSSLASETIIRAYEMGKNIQAICTETRPRYQGRKTAKELLSAGIPTTMVVDSAMRWAIRQMRIDVILAGCDAITSEGTIINKIGTRLLALAAKESDIPFYILSSLLKFDSDTSIGKRTTIEMRSADEVWPERPTGLQILNPAFETVSREYIDAIITERGLFPPEIVLNVIKEAYPFLIEFNSE